MIITVDVTQADIDQGEPEDCYECPIALAVARLLRRGAWLQVTKVTIALGITVSHHLFEAALPRQAADFIIAFDAHFPVAPFSFDLDVPDEWWAAIGAVRTEAGPVITGNCEACWHLWSVHEPSGCRARVYPSHSLYAEPCQCTHGPPDAPSEGTGNG